MSFEYGKFCCEILMVFQLLLQICFVTYSLIVIKTHFRQRKTRNSFSSFYFQVDKMLLNFFMATLPKKLFYLLQRHAEVIEQKLFQFTHFRKTSSLHFTGKNVTFYCTTKCFRRSWLFSIENVFWGQNVTPVYNVSPEVNPVRFLPSVLWGADNVFITSVLFEDFMAQTLAEWKNNEIWCTEGRTPCNLTALLGCLASCSHDKMLFWKK